MKLRSQPLLFLALVGLLGLVVVLSPTDDRPRIVEPVTTPSTSSAGLPASGARNSGAAPLAERVVPLPLASGAVESAPGSLECVFVAADDGRAPIGGVVVRRGLETLAIADDRGRCSLPRDAHLATAGELDSKAVACAEGFATSELDFSAARTGQREFVFELAPSAELRGHVRWSNGKPIPSGGRVIAWTDTRWLSLEAVNALLAGRASAHLFAASTDEAGAFHFRGLSHTQHYSVLGLGCGWITPSEPAPIVRPSDEPLELMASGLYGAVVEVRDARGERLSTSSRLLGAGPSWDADLQSARALFASEAQIALLAACDPGIARQLRSARRNSWESTLLLYARYDGTEGDLGPVDFAVTVPGFEMLHRDLTLPWLGRSIVTRTLVPLARTTCAGSCNAPTSEGTFPRGALRGTLLLHSPPDGETWSVAMDLADPASLVLEGVPCGEYVARFRAYDSYAQWPRGGQPSYAVRIVERERALVPIDMSHTGALELELVDERGRSYAGDWRISMEQGPLEGFTSIGVDLGRDRRVLGLIDPGEYRIRVEFISSLWEVLTPMTEVTIVRGQTASLVLPIRRRPK